MRTRFIFAAALTVFLGMATGLSAPAHAESEPSAWTTEFTRHAGSLFETTWWDDGHGKPMGSIERASWKQIFRSHFIFKDEFGELRAEGIQPWSLGVIVPSMAKLNILDAQGQAIAHVEGIFMTASASRFMIFNAYETHIADAWVDSSGQSIAFSHPRGQSARFASLVHTQGGVGSKRWQLQVANTDVIPDAAWPILGAFFSMKFNSEESVRQKQEEQHKQEELRRIVREESYAPSRRSH